MEKVGFINAVRLFGRGSYNILTGKPLVVSFEVTSSCNADCRHCDKGGIIKDEKHLSPEEIGAIYRSLRPVAVQLSGGEPLLRDDICEIARAIKEKGGVPYMILVSNGRLLTREKYLELKDAGVNQFSISLDFPDERHDDFRKLPGLFRRLERTVPKLTAEGNDDIILNTAISRENMTSLRALCDKAEEWGACMSYSAYSPLRTGDRSYSISSEEDLAVLRDAIDELQEMRRAGRRIRNTASILENTYTFFRDGGIPGCKAGYRFLLVTPEGYHRPCAHKRLKFGSQRELIENFSRTNDCGGCYVAIRSYCDKSYIDLVKEQIISRLAHQH
jgi:MoaA/NifB/PqqE/SkfB family radical SAM enzyme